MSKGVKMTLSEFVGNPDFGDWADDMDLPTAPTSYSYNNGGVEQRTMNEPPKPLPDHPPFVAYFGNLSFETQEQDIDNFLKDISDVDTIRLVRNVKEGNRSRGFAYVTFLSRDGLKQALSFNGKDLGGRAVKVDVSDSKYAEPRNEKPRGAFGGFGDRHQDSGRRNGPFGSSTRRQHSDVIPPQPRKKLELAPRTKPVEPIVPAVEKPLVEEPKKPKANPFGNAKPRDEESIMRQIEERRNEREVKESRPAPIPKEKPFGKPRERKDDRPAPKSAQVNSWRVRSDAPRTESAFSRKDSKNESFPALRKGGKSESSKKQVENTNVTNHFALLGEED